MATQYSDQTSEYFNVKLIGDYHHTTYPHTWECLKCGNKFLMKWDQLRNTTIPCSNCKQYLQEESLVRLFFRYVFGDHYYFHKERPRFLQTSLQKTPLELDGYEQCLQLAFEYQGKHHYKDKVYKNSNLKLIQLKDKIKKELCSTNGVLLIVIPYFKKRDYQEKILYLKELLLPYSQLLPPHNIEFLRNDVLPILNFQTMLIKWQTEAIKTAKSLSYTIEEIPTNIEGYFKMTCKNGHKLHPVANNFLRGHTSCKKCNAKWQLEKIIEVAKKHTSRKSFMESNPSAYNALCKYEKTTLLDAIWPPNRQVYTDDLLVQESKKYKSPREWELTDNNSYKAIVSRKHIWLPIKQQWAEENPKPLKTKNEAKPQFYTAERYLTKIQPELEEKGITCLDLYKKTDGRWHGKFKYKDEIRETRADHAQRGFSTKEETNNKISQKNSINVESIVEFLKKTKPYVTLDLQTYTNYSTPAKFIDAEYGVFLCKPYRVTLRNQRHPMRLKQERSDFLKKHPIRADKNDKDNQNLH